MQAAGEVAPRKLEFTGAEDPYSSPLPYVLDTGAAALDGAPPRQVDSPCAVAESATQRLAVVSSTRSNKVNAKILGEHAEAPDLKTFFFGSKARSKSEKFQAQYNHTVPTEPVLPGTPVRAAACCQAASLPLPTRHACAGDDRPR